MADHPWSGRPKGTTLGWCVAAEFTGGYVCLSAYIPHNFLLLPKHVQNITRYPTLKSWLSKLFASTTNSVRLTDSDIFTFNASNQLKIHTRSLGSDHSALLMQKMEIRA